MPRPMPARLTNLSGLTMVHRALVHILRSIAVVAVSAALTSAAYAQQSDTKPPRQRSQAAPSNNAQKPKPAARQRAASPCAEYGAGFLRMAGSDTCVRVGGSIDVGVGMSR